MKKAFYNITALSLISIFLMISCKKNSNVLTPTVIKEDNYFPMSLGSYWTNDTTLTNISVKDTIRIEVSPFTKTIGNNTYRLFISSKKDTIMYRKDSAGHYYQYSSLLKTVGVDRFEYKFLDDQLPVESSWQTDPVYSVYKVDATHSLPLKIVIKCTIVSKNQPFLMHSRTVDSVIHMKEELLFTSPDGSTDYTILIGIEPNDAYYAKKIGSSV